MSMLMRKRVAPCYFQDIRSHIENPRRIPIECSCLVSDMVVHGWSGHGKEMKIPCWISCKNQRGTVLSGFIKLPIFGGIKQYQYMIILRDFRFFLGLVIFHDLRCRRLPPGELGRLLKKTEIAPSVWALQKKFRVGDVAFFGAKSWNHGRIFSALDEFRDANSWMIRYVEKNWHDNYGDVHMATRHKPIWAMIAVTDFDALGLPYSEGRAAFAMLCVQKIYANWVLSLNFCVKPIISDFFWGIGFLSDLLQEVQGHNMALFELATGGVVMVRLYICLCNKCQVKWSVVMIRL